MTIVMGLDQHRAQITAGVDRHRHRRGVAHADLPGAEQDREILTLNAWEALAPREIAQVIDTNANIVRIRLYRARSHMKKRLGYSDATVPCLRTDAATHTASLPAGSMKPRA